jgi:AcrR family transcriptional regulator
MTLPSTPRYPLEPKGAAPGRRGARARQAILEAADDLLVAEGYAGVTIEGIAARAGVAKQTIYRWWTSKAELLMDGLLDDAATDLPPIDTGSAPQDLRLHLARLAGFHTDDPAGRVLAALIGQAQHDSQVAQELRRRYLLPRRAADRLMLERGIERGEIAGEGDLDGLLDALEGPIYHRVLILGGVADAAFIAGLVERGLRPRG